MVLRPLEKDAVLCFTQPAHALVSGALARAWGNGLFPEPRPRDEVCMAAAQHDLGMAAWEAEPELNADTGWPLSFLEMPVATHLRLWTAAPRLALSQGRWTALLVARHGAYLYSRRAGEPGVDDFLADMNAFAAAMQTSLDVSEEDAARAQRHLAAWDWMSLVLCRDDLPATVPAELEIQMERTGEGTVSVRPWPFRGDDPFEVAADARRLDGRFEAEAEMREALRVAPWQRVAWRLEAG